jgi:predicted membrane protein
MNTEEIFVRSIISFILIYGIIKSYTDSVDFPKVNFIVRFACRSAECVFFFGVFLTHFVIVSIFYGVIYG